MKVATERRVRLNAGKKVSIDRQVQLQRENVYLRLVGARTARIDEIKYVYAACRIQGLIRGFLSRIRSKELLLYWRAARTIQRLMRGKLGRMRWMKCFWLTTSVVKSATALKDLLLRSSLIRRDTKRGMNGWDWQERFDPLTNTVFYYNKQTGRNTWQCPGIFQRHLVCTWRGHPAFRAGTTVNITQFNPDQDTAKTMGGEVWAGGEGVTEGGGGGTLVNDSPSRSRSLTTAGGKTSPSTSPTDEMRSEQSFLDSGIKDAGSMFSRDSAGRLTTKTAIKTMIVLDKTTGKKKRIRVVDLVEPKDPLQQCRHVFKTVAELHYHLQTAHRWYCPSCDQKNTGLSFPMCTLCGNSMSETGIDGVDTMKESVKEIHARLDRFLHTERIHNNDEHFSIKDRLITLTEERRKRLEEIYRAVDMEAVDEVSWLGTGEGSDSFNSTSEWGVDLRMNAMGMGRGKKGEHRRGAQMFASTALDRFHAVVQSLYYNTSFPSSSSSQSEEASQKTNECTSLRGLNNGFALNPNRRSRSLPDGLSPSKKLLSLPAIPSVHLSERTGKGSVEIGGSFKDYSRRFLSRDLSTQPRHVAAEFDRSGIGSRNSQVGSSTGGGDNSARASDVLDEQQPLTQVSDALVVAKPGLRTLRHGFEGMVLGNGTDTLAPSNVELAQLPRPPPMRRTMPEKDTSASGVTWEEDSFPTPLATALQAPTRPRLGRSRASSFSSTSSSSVAGFGLGSGEQNFAKATEEAMTLVSGELETMIGDIKNRYLDNPKDMENGPLFDRQSESDPFEQRQRSCRTPQTVHQAREFVKRHGTKAEKPPIIFPLHAGIMFEKELDEVLAAAENQAADVDRMRRKRQQLNAIQRSAEETGVEAFDDDDPRLTQYGTYSTSWRDSTNRFRHLVCPSFMHGKCSLTTCPLAHPGVRDSSAITYSRPPGERKKLPLVTLCPDVDEFHNACEKGKLCLDYHVYVRPSTQEIIRRMYPLAKGRRIREFVSGAKVDGQYRDGNYNGYGVMTWPSRVTYMGDFVGGDRDGVGILRTPAGVEYVGGWAHGRRHGFGVMSMLTGDEYVGEFVDGKMEGVGRLTCANGDVYEGQFRHSRYHGLGTFRRYGGDVYMGYTENGMAQGLGILALNSGEKYKGYFDRNFRHGRGVCVYRNKSRYAGEFFRGYPDGFGVYVCPQGSKYIGQFSAGKKHGHGRYYFTNGEFYDGEFFKDKAKGSGVYYHANGNIYLGQWGADKRNGRGTYVFVNGSKFTGTFKDNDIDGKGKFDFACGSHYRGEFKKNLKHGRGVFVWPNGAQYKGCFIEDKMCGHGELTYASGHRYVGQWENNKKHGVGTFYYRRGHVFEGDWVEDRRHGKGKMTFFPGGVQEESYEGDWEQDEIHGVGTYQFRKDEGGVVYQGDWERGLRHGKGLLTYADGSFYRGDFIQEKMWGRGVFVSKDGSQYDGEWRANMRHGLGTQIDGNGNIFHGSFRMNMKHGEGVLQDCDGGAFRGTWQGGVSVGRGVFSMQVGAPALGGPKVIHVKCFAL